MVIKIDKSTETLHCNEILQLSELVLPLALDHYNDKVWYFSSK